MPPGAEVEQLGAERLADERVEVDRKVTRRIRKLPQVHDEKRAFFVLRRLLALRLRGDPLELPDVPLLRGPLGLNEWHDLCHLRFGLRLRLGLRFGLWLWLWLRFWLRLGRRGKRRQHRLGL